VKKESEEQIMPSNPSEKIVLYTARWCAQAVHVEEFLDKHGIVVEKFDIDSNSDVREKLIEINHGYASVPTLLFPDGTKLTEPTIAQLRKKLKMTPSAGLLGRMRSIFDRGTMTDSEPPRSRDMK
jgi:mycoredoxin